MKVQHQKHRGYKHLPWLRLSVVIIAVLLIACGVTISILNIQGIITGSWTNILGVVFTALGIITAIFQWLFPFSSGDTETPKLLLELPLVCEYRGKFNMGDDAAADFPYVITPIQDAYETAIQVLHDSCIDGNSVKHGILILGEANAGKTRLALEALKNTIPDWSFLRWFPYYAASDIPSRTTLYKRDVVIFIDDLQQYAPAESHEVNLQTLVVDNWAITLQLLMDTVRRTAHHVAVVATCRLEDEATARAHLSWLFDELAIIPLPRFNADAHDSGTATVISEFQKHKPKNIRDLNIRDWDGTLGSLVLGLSKKNSEYLKIVNEPAATVLRSMKLLTRAGTTDHTKMRIQKVCAKVFGEKRLKKSTGIWRSAVDQLTRLQFVTEEKISGEDDLGLVIRKDVYFDKVITDYLEQNRPHQLDQDLVQLQIAFTQLKDTQGLVNLARVLHQLGQDNKALEVYDLAAPLNPNDEIIWIRKGILLIILKQYREALVTYDHALSLNPNSVPSKEGRNLALLFMKPNKVPKANSEHDVDLKNQTYQLIDEFLTSHMKEELETFRELWKELKLFPLETLGSLKHLPSAHTGLGFAESQYLLAVISIICWAVVSQSQGKAKVVDQNMIVREAKSYGCPEALGYALALYLKSHLVKV